MGIHVVRLGSARIAGEGLRLGTVEQVIEPRFRREVEDAFGVVGGGVVQAGTTSGRCAGFFQLGALSGEADFSKTEENETENGTGVFLGFQPGIGAELVRRPRAASLGCWWRCPSQKGQSISCGRGTSPNAIRRDKTAALQAFKTCGVPRSGLDRTKQRLCTSVCIGVESGPEIARGNL